MTYERLERLRYSQPWRPQEQYRKQIGTSLKKVIADGNYQTLVIFASERWLRKKENSTEIESLKAKFPHQTWSERTSLLTIIHFDS
jgi:hypothetical protein